MFDLEVLSRTELSKLRCKHGASLLRFVCISPALCTMPYERSALEDVRPSDTMSTGFSTIMQPIDLDVSWKGQVDLKLLLAEDSISIGVFSLSLPPSFFLSFLTIVAEQNPGFFSFLGSITIRESGVYGFV